MFDMAQREMLAALAREHDLEPALVMAIIAVESGGRIFAVVDGHEEPLIRFEGHYFYRLLGHEKRNRAVVAGLAHQRAGRVANPSSQAGRWKMLRRAQGIDRPAALQSTSWGVGQVMGAHWQWLGYASIDHMVGRARQGLDGQAELMLRFIERAGLIAPLQRRDWRGFARVYNGPAFARHGYDRKLARAHDHFGETGDGPAAPSMQRHETLLLRLGDRGEAVRALQLQLRRHGHAIAADGDFGPLTGAALKSFQAAAGLVVDGIAGPASFTALERPPKSISAG